MQEGRQLLQLLQAVLPLQLQPQVCVNSYNDLVGQ